MSKILQLGKRAYVICGEKAYVTDIQEIREENAVMLAVPFSKGIPVYFAVGAEIEVGFWEPTGVYSYRAVVTQSIWINSLHMYLVKPLSRLTRLQRRENFRLPAACKAQVVLMPENAQEETAGELTVYTRDISLGGVSLKMPIPLEKDTKFICVIDLKEHGSIRAVCRVVHCREPDASDDTYVLGAEFIQCPTVELRRLARFLRIWELKERRVE